MLCDSPWTAAAWERWESWESWERFPKVRDHFPKVSDPFPEGEFSQGQVPKYKDFPKVSEVHFPKVETLYTGECVSKFKC